MSNIWFGSDFHLGHKNIQKFRTEVSSQKENEERIYYEVNALVGKRDSLYLLGDICFTMESIEPLASCPGTKYLVRGNHDQLNTSVYLKVFKEVYGLLKYKEFWLSHAPVHPNELRGRVNLHGHVHYNSISNRDYFNCCPENLWKLKGRCLISLEELREHYST